MNKSPRRNQFRIGDIKNSTAQCLRAIKRANLPVIHDLLDDMKKGRPAACVTLIRRLLSTSETALRQAAARGIVPQCPDRRVVVGVFDLLRELCNYKPSITVDQFLSRTSFVEHKMHTLTMLAEHVAQYVDAQMRMDGPASIEGGLNNTTPYRQPYTEESKFTPDGQGNGQLQIQQQPMYVNSITGSPNFNTKGMQRMQYSSLQYSPATEGKGISKQQLSQIQRENQREPTQAQAQDGADREGAMNRKVDVSNNLDLIISADREPSGQQSVPASQRYGAAQVQQEQSPHTSTRRTHGTIEEMSGGGAHDNAQRREMQANFQSQSRQALTVETSDADEGEQWHNNPSSGDVRDILRSYNQPVSSPLQLTPPFARITGQDAMHSATSLLGSLSKRVGTLQSPNGTSPLPPRHMFQQLSPGMVESREARDSSSLHLAPPSAASPASQENMGTNKVTAHKEKDSKKSSFVPLYGIATSKSGTELDVQAEIEEALNINQQLQSERFKEKVISPRKFSIDNSQSRSRSGSRADSPSADSIPVIAMVRRASETSSGSPLASVLSNWWDALPDELDGCVKMAKAGIPEGALLHKMTKEGIDADTQSAFKTAYANKDTPQKKKSTTTASNLAPAPAPVLQQQAIAPKNQANQARGSEMQLAHPEQIPPIHAESGLQYPSRWMQRENTSDTSMQTPNPADKGFAPRSISNASDASSHQDAADRSRLAPGQEQKRFDNGRVRERESESVELAQYAGGVAQGSYHDIVASLSSADPSSSVPSRGFADVLLERLEGRLLVRLGGQFQKQLDEQALALRAEYDNNLYKLAVDVDVVTRELDTKISRLEELFAGDELRRTQEEERWMMLTPGMK